MMNRNLFIFLFVAVVFTSGKDKPKFSYKTYGNVANYFENEKDFISFFEIKKGDVIAEVGAGSGANLPGFSMIADSITLYVQDIDSAILSKAAFNKAVKRAGHVKKKGANTFYYTIGTAKTTQLPDSLFDKIILISTFHEFTFMDEMMTDIYKKLKPNGKLYILESHCLSHKNYTADETIVMMKKYNFNLVKKDGKNINNSTGLFRMIYKK